VLLDLELLLGLLAVVDLDGRWLLCLRRGDRNGSQASHHTKHDAVAYGHVQSFRGELSPAGKKLAQ